MARKYINCDDIPGSTCQGRFSGEENEVIQEAMDHYKSVHGGEDTPEMRDKVRAMLKDEPSDYIQERQNQQRSA